MELQLLLLTLDALEPSMTLHGKGHCCNNFDSAANPNSRHVEQAE